MLVFQSIPALGLLLAAVSLALARRFCKAATLCAFLSVLCACALVLLTLFCGGSLHEALAYLLLPLFLLLPKEGAS